MDIPEEAVMAGIDAFRPNAPIGEIVKEVLEAARLYLWFAPTGDNHHNAAACPYCSPESLNAKVIETDQPGGILVTGHNSARLNGVYRRATSDDVT